MTKYAQSPYGNKVLSWDLGSTGIRNGVSWKQHSSIFGCAKASVRWIIREIAVFRDEIGLKHCSDKPKIESISICLELLESSIWRQVFSCTD
jgi:hypothetical protein